MKSGPLRWMQSLTGLCDRCKDLVFPRRCMLCGRIPEERGERFRRLGICPDCDPKRYRCFLPGENGDALRISYEYRDGLKKALEKLKYGGMADFGPCLGRWMWEEGKTWKALRRVTAVVPIPLAAKRQRDRGYNQAELMAEALAEEAGLPCRPLLRRIRETDPQKELGPDMRRRNVENCFRADPEVAAGMPSGAVILLIDDIYTTGATLDSAEEAIRTVLPKAEVLRWTLCGGASGKTP